MYHCEFSEKDKKFVAHARFHAPDAIIRKRMGILWYKILGYPHGEITRLSGASHGAVTATINSYRQGGLDKVNQRNPYRPKSQLQDYRKLPVAHFKEHPPATLKQAAFEIEKLTGIRRTPSSVRTFIMSIGMYRRKVGMVPSKADPDGSSGSQ